MTADDGIAPGAMWQLGDDDVTIARRLLEIASHPPRFFKGVDPTGPLKDWAHQIVQVDDMKVDRTGPLLAAQTHAILAVAAELAEANRIARGSNPDDADTVSRLDYGRIPYRGIHPGPGPTVRRCTGPDCAYCAGLAPNQEGTTDAD